MKNVTPRRESAPRAIGRAIFLIIGFVYAVWELRVLWSEIARAFARAQRR